MTDIGFPFSANSDATILVLGSMPSRKSLEKTEYYAHPQNGFWPIMSTLLAFDAARPYETRLKLLREAGVALWDVAHQCVRPGSMDSAIRIESVVANDFNSFFSGHPGIRAIFFNGRKAEELYHKLVLPELPEKFTQFDYHLLPSTSPANAGMSQDEKLAAWKIILKHLKTDAPDLI